MLAPIIAGFLFQAGYGLPAVSMLMAFGSTMAAIVLLFLKDGLQSQQPLRILLQDQRPHVFAD